MNNQTYTEIYELFEILGNREKIPTKFWNFIEKNKSKNYDKEQIQNNLWNGIISDEAISLYSILYSKYLCEDSFEKRILSEIYAYNSRAKIKIREEQKKIYNPNNFVKNDTKPKVVELETTSNTLSQNMKLAEIKEHIFLKIVRKIKAFFKIK